MGSLKTKTSFSVKKAEGLRLGRKYRAVRVRRKHLHFLGAVTKDPFEM